MVERRYVNLLSLLKKPAFDLVGLEQGLRDLPLETFLPVIPPPPTPHTLTVTVNDCTGAPLPGASVTATKGATTVGPITTNGSGVAVFSLPSSGSWSVTSTYTNLVNGTGTVSVGTSASITLANVQIASAVHFATTAGTTFPLTFGGNSIDYATGSQGFTSTICGACTGGGTVQSNFSFGASAGGCIVAFVTFNGCSCAGLPFPCGTGMQMNLTQRGAGCGTLGHTYQMNGTVTSFSQAPLTFSGTWSGVWANPVGGGYSDPAVPFSGGFTVT